MCSGSTFVAHMQTKSGKSVYGRYCISDIRSHGVTACGPKGSNYSVLPRSWRWPAIGQSWRIMVSRSCFTFINSTWARHRHVARMSTVAFGWVPLKHVSLSLQPRTRSADNTNRAHIWSMICRSNNYTWACQWMFCCLYFISISTPLHALFDPGSACKLLGEAASSGTWFCTDLYNLLFQLIWLYVYMFSRLKRSAASICVIAFKLVIFNSCSALADSRISSPDVNKKLCDRDTIFTCV
jgi:hypothetical protein